MSNEIIYEVDGNMGKILRVYDDRCVISVRSGVKALFFGNALNGDKEFYYKDITSVQFKNVGVTTGYLQFEYAGSHSGNNFSSENSFTFSATIGTSKHKQLQTDMPGIYEDIRNRINQAKDTTKSTTLSTADELKKYKELLDSGVISQEEFDAKKKQLLGV